MSQPILVTGATGKTGKAVVLELLARSIPVRALVHRDDARSAELRQRGATVVVADLHDALAIRSALTGVSRAYYCAPWNPQALHTAAIFAAAAYDARLPALIAMSQWLAGPESPAYMTRLTWASDRIFSQLPDTAHITLNVGYFADNYLRPLNYAAHLGIYPSVTGRSRNAPPSNEDIARVIVAALLDPERYAGTRLRPTGPQLLSTHDMVEIFARVLNRSVRHVDLPFALFRRAVQQVGLSTFEQSSMFHYTQEHLRGAFEIGAPNSVVADLTGRDPEDFETITRRYAALPQNRRTLPNVLRTVRDNLLLPFVPIRDFKRYEREHDIPSSSALRYAAESAHWRAEHEPQLASATVA